MARHCDVLVIGGGVIGASIAYELSERGVKATVIDKGRMGYGCSYGNAGWIVPSHAFPLPMPGALSQAARWMFKPDSPLYIKLRLNADLWRWLWRFLRSANERHLRYAVPALVQLASLSMEAMERFVARHGTNEIGFEKRGLIYVCGNDKTLETMAHEASLVRDLGVTSRMLDEKALRAMQPAVTGPIAGGIFFDQDAHAEPLAVVQAMLRHAEQRGAMLLPETEVFAIESQGRCIEAVRTTRGRMTADQYVLATGAWTPALTRPLRLPTPIEAGKGYALVVKSFDPAPTVPLMLVDKKIAVTPRHGSIRLAGTMELAGLSETITPRRVDAILRGGRQYLNLPESVEVIETWRGLRPCTPDGLPIIGRPRRWDNLLLATGHAMLGLTLAAGTAAIIADLHSGQTPPMEPKPFDPNRFERSL